MNIIDKKKYKYKVLEVVIRKESTDKIYKHIKDVDREAYYFESWKEFNECKAGMDRLAKILIEDDAKIDFKYKKLTK